METKMEPPKNTIGIIGWLRKNLFNGWFNSLLTIIFLWIVFTVLYAALKWVFVTADWTVIVVNLRLLLVGQYPQDQIFRVWLALTLVSTLTGLSWGLWKGTIGNLAIALGASFLILSLFPFSGEVKTWLLVNATAIGLGYVLGRYFPILRKPTAASWILLFPFIIVLLRGLGTSWLPIVGTNLWGGLMLTFLLAIVAIVFSFPLGVLLALGRTSKLPLVRYLSIGYIELIRGVPLITILFMAQLMLPLFLPEGVTLDRVLRAMAGLTLFSAAYLAENVRSGLQSIPRGQYEAAQALGLSNFKTTFLIVLPQALRAVIPILVGQFIALFKDTSLVSIVGILDFLGIGRSIVAQPEFLGRQREILIFAAAIYFVFSYAMSYASRRLEKSLGVGER